MNKIKPTKPSFLWSYWKPWKESSNFFDSYLEYAKDTSLAKYSSDIVGQYIQDASQDQIQTIKKVGSELGIEIGEGLGIIATGLKEVKNELLFLNRNLTYQLEQQKLTNSLLTNLSEWITVSDDEKERIRHIQLGVKFLSGAHDNIDLYKDALQEFSVAEQMMPQDMYVLDKIGMIYLIAPQFINPKKAISYFENAAKYSILENNSKDLKRFHDALSGYISMTDRFVENDEELSKEDTFMLVWNAYVFNDEEAASKFELIRQKKFIEDNYVSIITSEYYSKAGYCAYIIGDFKRAVELQKQAVVHHSTPEHLFHLAKYHIRNKQISLGCSVLNKAISHDSKIINACFKDLDIINESKVLTLISSLNQKLDTELKNIIDELKRLDYAPTRELLNNFPFDQLDSFVRRALSLSEFKKTLILTKESIRNEELKKRIAEKERQKILLQKKEIRKQEKEEKMMLEAEAKENEYLYNKFKRIYFLITAFVVFLGFAAAIYATNVIGFSFVYAFIVFVILFLQYGVVVASRGNTQELAPFWFVIFVLMIVGGIYSLFENQVDLITANSASILIAIHFVFILVVAFIWQFYLKWFVN